MTTVDEIPTCKWKMPDGLPCGEPIGESKPPYCGFHWRVKARQ